MEEEPATPTDARFARDAQIQSEVPESMAPLGEDAGIGPLLQRFGLITATFIPERIADFKAENARIAWSQHMEGAGLMIEVDTGGGANKRPIIQERPPWDRMKFFQGPNDVVYAVHTKEMASQMATRGYKLVSVVALPNDPQTLPPCVEMVTRGGRGAGPSEPDPMSLPMPPKPFIPKIGRRASDPPVAAQILGHFEDKVVIKNDGGVETAYRPMKGWDAESRSAAKFSADANTQFSLRCKMYVWLRSYYQGDDPATCPLSYDDLRNPNGTAAGALKASDFEGTFYDEMRKLVEARM